MRYIVLTVIALSACTDNIPTTKVEDVLFHQKHLRISSREAKKQFLAHIAELESGSGRNTNHKMMTAGIHAGQRAVGRYGLMPLTIMDMIIRMKKEKSLPGLLKTSLTGQDLAAFVAENEDLEQIIAERLYDFVYKRFNGDQERMAAAWVWGHNGHPERFIEGLDRTEKFRELSLRHQALK